MLSLAEIADQYAWLYTGLPTPPGKWSYLFPTPGCWVGLLETSDAYYPMFRGSDITLDWVRDAEAVPFPDQHLGWVHAGFRRSVLSNIGWINAHLVSRSKKVVPCGHSLGAGLAALFTGYRLCDGLPVDGLTLFGSPRPGGPQLRSIVERAGVEVASYCNEDEAGHDEITDIPPAVEVGGIGIQYCHLAGLTPVTSPPPEDDEWGPFRYHHFGLYCRAVGANGEAARSLKV